MVLSVELFQHVYVYIICLTLRMPGTNFSRRHFEIFFLFSPENKL